MAPSRPVMPPLRALIDTTFRDRFMGWSPPGYPETTEMTADWFGCAGQIAAFAA
jgi:hypothetical protein